MHCNERASTAVSLRPAVLVQGLSVGSGEARHGVQPACRDRWWNSWTVCLLSGLLEQQRRWLALTVLERYPHQGQRNRHHVLNGTAKGGTEPEPCSAPHVRTALAFAIALRDSVAEIGWWSLPFQSALTGLSTRSTAPASTRPREKRK